VAVFSVDHFSMDVFSVDVFTEYHLTRRDAGDVSCDISDQQKVVLRVYIIDLPSLAQLGWLGGVVVRASDL